MNIFRLDNDIQRCAEYHTDKHVVKMILEHCQLMSTAHHVLGTTLDLDSVYRKTHVNHPSGVWVRQSASNYEWVHKLTVALSREYTHRYGKFHLATRSGLLRRLSKLPIGLKDIGDTKQILAMPTRYHTHNPVVAYRNYYVNEKSHLFEWRERDMPPWLVQFGFVSVGEEN